MTVKMALHSHSMVAAGIKNVLQNIVAFTWSGQSMVHFTSALLNLARIDDFQNGSLVHKNKATKQPTI